MNTNRRQFSRIAFHTHAELTTGHGQFDVVVLDLSLKGGLIRMPLWPQDREGRELRCAFRSATSMRPSACRAP